MRLNLNLAIKHDINNWVPNEEGGAGAGGAANQGGAGGAPAGECPAEKKGPAVTAAEANTAEFTGPVKSTKMEGDDCIVTDSADKK